MAIFTTIFIPILLIVTGIFTIAYKSEELGGAVIHLGIFVMAFCILYQEAGDLSGCCGLLWTLVSIYGLYILYRFFSLFH